MQWAVIIGAYVGYRLLGSLSQDHPEIKPWVWPIQIAYLIFAIMTWIASPLFNLLLRLNRFGKLALAREQVVASNFIGAGVVLFLTAFVYWLATRQDIAFLAMLVFGFLLIPVAGTFNCTAGWPRSSMAAYTMLLAVVGIAGLGLFFVAGNTTNRQTAQMAGYFGYCLVMLFLAGVFASQWVAIALSMVRPRR